MNLLAGVTIALDGHSCTITDADGSDLSPMFCAFSVHARAGALVTVVLEKPGGETVERFVSSVTIHPAHPDLITPDGAVYVDPEPAR